MPRAIARAARVGIDLLPHVGRMGDPVFLTVVDLAVEAAYEIRREEAKANNG